MKPLAVAALGLSLITAPALAERGWMSTQDNGDGTVRSASGPMPGAGHAGQYWQHPKGCEYSRAGRPGETVWYLIISTRVKGCPTYIVQRGFRDAY